VTKSSVEFAVFCKAPIAGRVKTRLIPAFGAEKAAQIYRALLLKTLVTVDEARQRLGASASLWVADDLTDSSLLDLSQRFGLPRYAQSAGDLGDRMFTCLRSLQQKATRVVLIGTDCPAFTPEHLVNAANALTPESPWVFTPAEDGGYVLVGTSQADELPFRDMRWSDSTVMAETRRRLADASLMWSEMPTLWDVDCAADVNRAEQLGWL
jgi:uncharacterized protein